MIAYFFGDRSEWLIQAIFLAAAIVILQSLASIYGGLKHWLLYAAVLKQGIVRDFLRWLHTNNMPRPLPYDDTDSYLSKEFEDESEPIKQRLAAAVLAGEFGGMRTTKPMTSMLMAHSAFDAALRRFETTAKRDRASEQDQD